MGKKIALIILIPAVAVCVVAPAVYFRQKYNSVEGQVSRLKLGLAALDKKTGDINSENEKLRRDNADLKNDTAVFGEFTAKLQKEKDELNAQLAKANDMAQRTAGQAQDLQKRLDDITQKLKESDDKLRERSKDLQAQADALKEKLAVQSGVFNKERGQYFYNAGVLYMKMGKYAEAAQAFEKSLSYDVLNADGHYNLGLISEEFYKEPELAVMHYRKYLELKPAADDAKEVEGWITQLMAAIYK